MAIYNLAFGRPENINGGVVLNGGVPYNNNRASAKTFSNKRRVQEFPFGSALVSGVNITGNNDNLNIPVPFSSPRPLVKRASKTVAGQPSSAISTSGSLAPELKSTIHPIDSYRTRLEHQAYSAGLFNIYTGKYAAGYPDNQIDFFGVDEAANVSRSNQGKLFFKHYRAVSVVNYPARTG